MIGGIECLKERLLRIALRASEFRSIAALHRDGRQEKLQAPNTDVCIPMYELKVAGSPANGAAQKAGKRVQIFRSGR
jgi:hypothetical protein